MIFSLFSILLLSAIAVDSVINLQSMRELSKRPPSMSPSTAPSQNSNGANVITSGYMVNPYFSDSQCSQQSIFQVQFQQLGICLRDWDNPSAQSYITYYVETPRDWVDGYFYVEFFTDTVCGTYSYTDYHYLTGCQQANNVLAYTFYYSATVPLFGNGVYQL